MFELTRSHHFPVSIQERNDTYCNSSNGCDGIHETHQTELIDMGTSTFELDASFEFQVCNVHLLTDVADVLGISIRQVELLIRDGDLGAVNVGRGLRRRDLRVLESALQEFLEARRVVAHQRRASPPAMTIKAERFERGGYAETWEKRMATKGDQS